MSLTQRQINKIMGGRASRKTRKTSKIAAMELWAASPDPEIRLKAQRRLSRWGVDV
jgi:hypothetical protein